MGLGGRIGNGNQYMSWIALDDLLEIVLHAIANKSITGPINAVAPNPITNTDFTGILGKVLSRSIIFHIPKFIINAVLGEELANAAVLSSTRVVSAHLLKIGYQFRFPHLELALGHTLGKSISKIYR